MELDECCAIKFSEDIAALQASVGDDAFERAKLDMAQRGLQLIVHLSQVAVVAAVGCAKDEELLEVVKKAAASAAAVKTACQGEGAPTAGMALTAFAAWRKIAEALAHMMTVRLDSCKASLFRHAPPRALVDDPALLHSEAFALELQSAVGRLTANALGVRSSSCK